MSACLPIQYVADLGAAKNELQHKVKSKTKELEETKLLGDASERVEQLETSSEALTDEKAKLVKQLTEARPPYRSRCCR